MNLPDKDFYSRYVAACEDVWDYQICLRCVLGSHHVPGFPLSSEWKANVCRIHESCFKLQTRMRLMFFISKCVCVKRAYVPECFCIGQLCAIAISGFLTRLACPASARTSAQLAGFSLLASESLLTGRPLHPVFVIGFP